MIAHIAALTFGTDPEGFFATHDGKIVGAEKVLPKSGELGDYTNKTVLDGVQFELHPLAGHAISDVGFRLAQGFRNITTHLRTSGLDKQFKVDFSQVVMVDPDELKTLSDAARQLGCQPSENFYRKHPINVPKDFPMRSAAGHIHLGFSSYSQNYIWIAPGVDHRRLLVPLLDIFVGNTCVMLDRDPKAAERRKLYGHAGEWRPQPHGIEYRTTSNFWLKSFALMDLVFGLANTAVQVLGTTLRNVTVNPSYDPEAILAEKINLKKIERAIERNDAALAWENWTALIGFFKEHVPRSAMFPIHCDNVDQATEFLKVAAANALTPFLPADPVAHWLSCLHTNNYGELHNFKGQGWPDLLAKVTKPTP